MEKTKEETLEKKEMPMANETPAELLQKADSPTREQVTIVVTYREDDCESHLCACVNSIVKNLKGVDADIIVVSTKRPGLEADGECLFEVPETAGESSRNTWLWRAMEAVLPRIETERIVLMDADMMLLQPCLLDHIGVPKATKNMTPEVALMHDQDMHAHDYVAHTPVLMCRSLLGPILSDYQHPDHDLRTVYFSLQEEQAEIKPQIIEVHNGAWRNDPWLLPVVSNHIDASRVVSLQASKPFMWLAPSCRGEEVDRMLTDLFG